MSDVTLIIDEQKLIEAIARVLVERSQGADRLQAIESKAVANHVKNLLAGLNVTDRMDKAINASIECVGREILEKHIRYNTSHVERLVDSFFTRPAHSSVSPAERAVHMAIVDVAKEMIEDAKASLRLKVQEFVSTGIERIRMEL